MHHLLYHLLLFALAVWGMTHILVFGEIFERIRPKHRFFHCPMCIGFHAGWFLFLLFRFAGIRLFPNICFGMFVFGCIGSAVSFALIFTFTEEGISVTKSKQEDDDVQSA